MKRVAGGLIGAMLFIGWGCQNWNTELGVVLNRIDGGEMTGDGGPDAGTDAGSDAGCMRQLCLNQSFEAGLSFSPIAVVDQTFMSVGRSPVRRSQLAVFIDGGFTLTTLAPTISGPVGLLAQSPNDYFVAAENGVSVVRDGGTQTSTTCNMPMPSPAWWGVSGNPASTVTFVGDIGRLCTWTADGGFEGIDMQTITDPSASGWLKGVAAFDTGERFIIGDQALLMYWAPPATASVYQHSANKGDMQAIDGPSPDALWAVGQFGMAARWNPVDGGHWLELPLIPGITTDINALWVRTNDDVWLVGGAGLFKHWNGTAWNNVTVEEVDSTVDLKGVRGSGPSDLMVSGTRNLPDGGERGLLLYYRRNP
ncbi:MAG: hypothetical protein K1X64_00140 [Myxococcaceae bacterium]|nr:hypothetical protein [Myxococcaceae bacterium]